MFVLCLEAFCPRKFNDGNQNFENRRRFFLVFVINSKRQWRNMIFWKRTCKIETMMNPELWNKFVLPKCCYRPTEMKHTITWQRICFSFTHSRPLDRVKRSNIVLKRVMLHVKIQGKKFRSLCKQLFDLQIFASLLTLMHDHGLWVGYKA